MYFYDKSLITAIKEDMEKEKPDGIIFLSFSTLKDLPKIDIEKDDKQAKINEILLDALIEAHLKYKRGSEYPHYKIIDL